MTARDTPPATVRAVFALYNTPCVVCGCPAAWFIPYPWGNRIHHVYHNPYRTSDCYTCHGKHPNPEKVDPKTTDATTLDAVKSKESDSTPTAPNATKLSPSTPMRTPTDHATL